MPCQLAHTRLVHPGQLSELVQVIALDSLLSQAIELLDDAVFHLGGRLVGKGDGEQLSMGIKHAVIVLLSAREHIAAVISVKQQMLDVLLRQFIGLARARRCLHHQHVAAVSGSVAVPVVHSLMYLVIWKLMS